ncbi:MAG: hypothetical protein QOE86_490 [Solirubrobacteraceae bacterium]|jgi:predicted peroxiredoxin|nr:hypothetical protein [Solirubrobacteraceae bacterium]
MQDARRKLLVGCSHGAEDALRVTAAYLTAVAGARRGNETALWLTSDGVRLAIEGYVDGIRAAPAAPAVRDLHAQLTEAAGRLFVCPVALQALMLGDEALVAAAEVARAERVLEWAGADVLTLSY